MLKAEDERWMRLAIRKAREGIGRSQTPFGACIVRRGRVIAVSHNQVWGTTDITAHAEICAIRRACRKLKTIDLSGCTIYSTYEPCPMCFAACHWANITRIVYGAGIRDARKAGFNELAVSSRVLKKLSGSKVRIKKDFLYEECLELFSLWKARPESRVY